jgi:hypothetical protein
LLFGILALQLNFIDHDALVTAINAWVLHKEKANGHRLRDQGKLEAERLQLHDARVAEYHKAFGNDARQCLAALSSVCSASQTLGGIADQHTQASLFAAGSARPFKAQTTGPDFARGAESLPAMTLGCQIQPLRGRAALSP